MHPRAGAEPQTCSALLDTLCFANLPSDGGGSAAVASLHASHALAAAAFSDLPPPESAAFSRAWYLKTQARLQINHFRVQLPLPLHVATSAPELLAGATGAAVYAFASLLNHSCVPNVDVEWLRGTAAATFRVSRDVATGEELTVAYVEPSLAVAQRQARLRHGWGFACACPACAADLADR